MMIVYLPVNVHPSHMKKWFLTTIVFLLRRSIHGFNQEIRQGQKFGPTVWRTKCTGDRQHQGQRVEQKDNDVISNVTLARSK